MIRFSRVLISVLCITDLIGCASFPSLIVRKPTNIEAITRNNSPSSWQASLPHHGQIDDLKQWWQSFNDPFLVELISSAQVVNPSIATSRWRIAQAKASQVSATSTLLPSVNANAFASRGLQNLFFPVSTMTAIGLEASWELDIFGGNRAGLNAAEARMEAATNDWHAARISVAAEVANYYTHFRNCEAHLAQAETNANSLLETQRLTELLTKTGFQSLPFLGLAQANAAQALNTSNQIRAQCELNIKALVSLTGLSEPELRLSLKKATAKIPSPEQFELPNVPAQALAQRPDIRSAGQEIIAASADITQLQAQQYPKISFSGNISAMHMQLAVSPRGGTVWSIGPIAVTLPIFDGGRRSANVDAARAHYEEVRVGYVGKIRNAVREVEEALVNLQSIDKRNIDVQKALQGYTDAFQGISTLYKSGMASLIELEDARRNMLLAQNTLLDLQHDRTIAWISLYRALGGDWKVEQLPT